MDPAGVPDRKIIERGEPEGCHTPVSASFRLGAGNGEWPGTNRGRYVSPNVVYFFAFCCEQAHRGRIMRIRETSISAAFFGLFVFIGQAAEPGIHEAFDVKCGTPLVLEMLGKRGKIASARLDLHCSAVSRQGRFRAHYDTSGSHAPDLTDLDMNGVPDWVDSTLAYLEYAWAVQIDQMGFNPPKSDNGLGGGSEIDVYIRNMGIGGPYGVVWPDDPFGNTSSAYIILDNDYSEDHYLTKGYAALRVTTAHEFFHVIQFGYRNSPESLIWWMEQTATWMEDHIWDDVNDYLAYLVYFFQGAKTEPLDSNKGLFKYGAVIWPMYLSNRFGDNIIREAWEALALAENPRIGVLDAVIPGGLNAALNEFGVWNYFTNYRAGNGHFYPDGPLFDSLIGMDISAGAHPAEDILSTKNLTSNYIELLFLGGWGERDALRIRTAVESDRSHENSLIFYNGPYDYRIHRLTQPETVFPLERPWNRAILVTTCVNPSPANGQFQFRAEWDTAVTVEEAHPSALAVRGAVPNPFNSLTTIAFTLPAGGNVRVVAYNVHGQKVADLFSGVLSAGEKRILWKPDNLSGGVYFVHVVTPFGSHTSKALYLK